MDTRLKKSTVFHPQTDGQTEVVNKTVIQLLKGYCSKHPKLWDDHLCYVQHVYNRAKHSSTQRSPFEICFGFIPRSPLNFVFSKDITVDGHSDVDKATRFIKQIQEIYQAMQEQLEQSQAKYKARHDKHQIEHRFYVGDQVWLYIRKDRMQGEGKKLKPTRYGPFKILEKIGENVFRLDLPAYMHIYSVVNEENLRLFEPSLIEDPEEQSQLPSIDDLLPEYLNELQEDTILDRKVRTTAEGILSTSELDSKVQNPVMQNG